MELAGYKHPILYPLITEDAINQIESENKLIFIVNLRANKSEVKKAIEEMYEVKVEQVNLLRTSKGLKKAFVKLTSDFKSSDLAIKLGIF